MKRHLLLLLVVGLTFGIFAVNAGSARAAYDWGCDGGNMYSTATGEYCGSSGVNYNYFNSSNSYGCTSGGPFNVITGAPCYGSSYNYPSYNSPQSYNQQFQIGDRGAGVVALQQMLQAAGFYGGRIDGIYGPMTHVAYLNYQTLHQYPAYPYPTYSPTRDSGYMVPQIDSISPRSGKVGTKVTIRGTGFGYDGCTSYACTNSYQSSSVTINFDGARIPVSATNGKTLTFYIPSYITPDCPYSPYGCYSRQEKVVKGVYSISVSNSYGTSDTENFSVTGR